MQIDGRQNDNDNNKKTMTNKMFKNSEERERKMCE